MKLIPFSQIHALAAPLPGILAKVQVAVLVIGFVFAVTNIWSDAAQSASLSDSVDREQCAQLRDRATALHQERAGMSDTEDVLALAVGMEALDVALEEIA